MRAKKAVGLLFLLALAGAGFALDGARYLVICRDEFASAVMPLVEWRHATGLPARLVKLSEIGADTTAVRNYIVNAYQTWPVRPEYVLVVADPAFLRAKIYGTGPTRYYTDNYYADVAGDFRAELLVGRFPARTFEQCRLLTEKTLAYERSPELSDSLWMRRLTTIIREDGDADDSIYWSNVRQAAGLAAGTGFLSCDSFSYFRGHTVSHVLSSVNAGTGLVLYRGRASGNWYPPFNVDPAQTANGAKLPVVLSVTCETMALTPTDSMAGQWWTFAGTSGNPRGAVAFFGNTHSAMGVAPKRSAVCRGFFTGLLGENRHRLGAAALRAREQLYSEFPDTLCREDYRGFNLFGDPALAVWTATPRRLAVTHQPEILPGRHFLSITVTSAGSPVSGALVCASMDTAVYTSAATNSQGKVTLDVNPTDTGSIRLTVTGQNLCPYDGVIRVVSQVALAGEKPPVGDRSPLTATIVRDVLVLPQSLFAGPGAACRLLDAAGREVGRLDPGANDIGHLPAGVYYCEFASRSGVPARARFTRLY